MWNSGARGRAPTSGARQGTCPRRPPAGYQSPRRRGSCRPLPACTFVCPRAPARLPGSRSTAPLWALAAPLTPFFGLSLSLLFISLALRPLSWVHAVYPLGSGAVPDTHSFSGLGRPVACGDGADSEWPGACINNMSNGSPASEGCSKCHHVSPMGARRVQRRQQ